VKKVQHPTGGVVGEVRAHDGDRVKAGEILIRLDETVTRANLAARADCAPGRHRRYRRGKP